MHASLRLRGARVSALEGLPRRLAPHIRVEKDGVRFRAIWDGPTCWPRGGEGRILRPGTYLVERKTAHGARLAAARYLRRSWGAFRALETFADYDARTRALAPSSRSSTVLL